MRKTLAASLLSLSFVVGSGTAAMAQTTTTESPAAEQEDDNGSNGLWGLAGLLGLAGLAGLRKNKNDTMSRPVGASAR